MNGKNLLAIGSGLLLSFAGIANAAGPNDADLQAKVDALQARVQELEAKENGATLNAQRTEEVKALVREVLADADTRASLQGTGATAGHDGTNFFISSADGNSMLKFWGLIQPQYIWNLRQNHVANSSSSAEGFQIRRTELDFSGHVYSPRILYEVRLDVSTDTDAVSMQRAWIGYKFMDNKMKVWVGEVEDPFTRETLVADNMQTAVDRSTVDGLFSAGFIQGIGLDWDCCEWAHAKFCFNDGVRSGSAFNVSPTEVISNAVFHEATSNSKDFDANHNNFGLTARGDLKLAGQWSQWNQLNSFSQDDLGIFVGAALHYQDEGNDSADPAFGNATARHNQFIEYTIDGSVAYKGWSLFASANGLTTMLGDDTESRLDTVNSGNVNIYGLVVQGAYCWNDKIEPFVRLECFVTNDLKNRGIVAKDNFTIITAGVNLYQHKHNAKVTADVVWGIDPIGSSAVFANSATTGLLTDAAGSRNQIAVRLQYTLRF